MLEDLVASLLQKYLGNYIIGLSKEALKISVWNGDVVLKNMQLKPEALNALNLPVKVRAGFLGSVRLKVPWSRLGQEPVLVYLDRIFILAEPATQMKRYDEDTVQEAKKNRIRELEMKLMESKEQLASEINTSWLSSLINTVIGNLKLSIMNIHIRYEDCESNPGHPFAAGMTMEKLSAVTIDDSGKETFATGGALQCIQKSVELESLSLYLDSNIQPWKVEKPWENLLPSEWSKIFELETGSRDHCYILQPVSGNAYYIKENLDDVKSMNQPQQKAVISLDDVTLCLSKYGYRNVLMLADNFASFNQRLKYAHFRPLGPVKSNPNAWWKYACKAIAEQMKKASGRLSWDQVLRYARLRKRYISIYASLLKSDGNRLVVEGNKDIDMIDSELDIEVVLQWRMLAHEFVKKTMGPTQYLKKQSGKKSWWSFGWSTVQSNEDEIQSLSEEDWVQLNRIIGYKEVSDELLLTSKINMTVPHTILEIHMRHNASKLLNVDYECLAELSCEGLDCLINLFSEAKVFDLKLGSYHLSSPNGLLAESATTQKAVVGIFSYKPFDAEVDWHLGVKASPCYMTYLKNSIDEIIAFFQDGAVSKTVALEAAAAMQMTIDGVKRTAQQQVTRALKDRTRFSLDFDIAAPKVTIPTGFCPDGSNATKLLIDLGKFRLSTKDDSEYVSPESDRYLQFYLGLSDVSAFLVDGQFDWTQILLNNSASYHLNATHILPIMEKCGMAVILQQIRTESPAHPSARVSVRLPSLGFHFSPARYHRLMQVAKLFEDSDEKSLDVFQPWVQADFETWLSVLAWKGVANREAVWQRRYVCLVGSFLYILEHSESKTYKQFLSLRGRQVCPISVQMASNIEHVLAVIGNGKSSIKALEDVNALILRFDSEDAQRTWQNHLQGAIYQASGSVSISGLSNFTNSEQSKDNLTENVSGSLIAEKLLLIGVLDELKISVSCNNCGNCESYIEMLLGNESPLFEFRATGGQVELLIKDGNMFIGTVLNSLEIEDLNIVGLSRPQFIARSFISNTNDMKPSASSSLDEKYEIFALNDSSESDGDIFFEASENVADLMDSPRQLYRNTSIKDPRFRFLMDTPNKPPRFECIPSLIPQSDNLLGNKELSTTDNFVKAQMIIYNKDSSSYSNVDKQIHIALATLSFFCHRPTVLAILQFVNAINIEEDTFFKNKIYGKELDNKSDSNAVLEPTMKGLLGKGKSRIIFQLTLNMARAQILLMNENGERFATLLQNNLSADIKVFPSSFSICAALGNLKISDDSLPKNHSYFWICDTRNPGGSSFVELLFSSFSVVDDDYKGYDYSLSGKLSEVRIVYLNRFVKEVSSYFMDLAPSSSFGVVKLKDQVTNSEKWFTTTEVEGSPALLLDISLNEPIILLPRETQSSDYLELDVLNITVHNTFCWLGGDKNEMRAVHLEILNIQVEDINLTVCTGLGSGESVIQEVNRVSVVIRRALRNLLNQIPSIDVSVKIEEVKASLSSQEYQIITECALSNISETPNTLSLLNHSQLTSKDNVEKILDLSVSDSGVSYPTREDALITMKILVEINLIELCLHSGATRDVPLATLQVNGAWFIYKSISFGEDSFSATLKSFTVVDDREDTEPEYKYAIRKAKSIECTALDSSNSNGCHVDVHSDENRLLKNNDSNKSVVTMLIIDAMFNSSCTTLSLCIQRPQLLVALDFLLAFTEFFVPTIRDMLSDGKDFHYLLEVDAIILSEEIYYQPTKDFTLSPKRPLVADDEKFDIFVYDGKGGNLYLHNRQGVILSKPSREYIIYVGSGKRLQFKNVSIKNGEYLDSCISLGSKSSYSVSKEDGVFLDNRNSKGKDDLENGIRAHKTTTTAAELVINIEVLGPELTFYNSSKNVDESLLPSKKLLHAQLDLFCRVFMKGDNIDINANALELAMESDGFSILEPFDTKIRLSKYSGKTQMEMVVSDIFMNVSFRTLHLFLAVQEDILTFLRMTSRKVSVLCTQFDKVGTILNKETNQTYAFWRARAPPGFAVLGDCLTPLNEPPKRGVIAVNTSFARVKKPLSFKLIWQSFEATNSLSIDLRERNNCSIWLPIAPSGYISMGCVVTTDGRQPSPSSILCILASSVNLCALKDCVTLNYPEIYPSKLVLWRLDNSIGSFLPMDPIYMNLVGKPYELRHMTFGYFEGFSKDLHVSKNEDSPLQLDHNYQINRSSSSAFQTFFEEIHNFTLVWSNQGMNNGKEFSIWRPITPSGLVYLGDIAVKGYQPPDTIAILQDKGDEYLKVPLDFQLVGQFKKQKGLESISFWLPLAPPGFVSLGCVVCKEKPKHEDFRTLRCIRNDMVVRSNFSEESIWDTSNFKIDIEPFSVWVVGNEVGLFIARYGLKRPPKRIALKVIDTDWSSGTDDIIVTVEIKEFSATLFDDYGCLMAPLFSVSLSDVECNLHGKSSSMNTCANFSLALSSYNDEFDSWEPLVEPLEASIRYKYSTVSESGSQLHLTSTKDLNVDISVSCINMILQAYSRWKSLSDTLDTRKEKPVYATSDRRSITDSYHNEDHYIVPKNKLGRDVFIQALNTNGILKFRLTSGEDKLVMVPLSSSMSNYNMKGKCNSTYTMMIVVVVAYAKLTIPEDLSRPSYATTLRLCHEQTVSGEPIQKQMHTRGNHGKISDNVAFVIWNETFFFKVDTLEKYFIEFTVTDMGKDETIGIFSAHLEEIEIKSYPGFSSLNLNSELTWMDLPLNLSMMPDAKSFPNATLTCGILVLNNSEDERKKKALHDQCRTSFMQISPTNQGPWTSVKLNYAAPIACWRLGDDVIASEVNIKDGNRYVNLRSLVSVHNNTCFIVDLRLKPRNSLEKRRILNHKNKDKDNSDFQVDEFFEIERYDPSIGWVGYFKGALSDFQRMFISADSHNKEMSDIDVPPGWELLDDWHLDNTLVATDGWVYASDMKYLKWFGSLDQASALKDARIKRWIRKCKPKCNYSDELISVGLLNPGGKIALPLPCLTNVELSYVLEFKPITGSENEYSWSLVLDKNDEFEASDGPKELSQVCVSSLVKAEEIIYCSQTGESSVKAGQGLWFCLSIQATEIGKDVKSNPIEDWSIIISSPLSLINFLPHSSEYSVLEKLQNGQFFACEQGLFSSGQTVEVYNADIRRPLYLSLIPQGGWQPEHDAVLISHPNMAPSKILGLRSPLSKRIVQVILEQNLDKEQVSAKVIRIYSPYWIASARCPPLTYKLMDISGKRERSLSFPFLSTESGERVVWQICDEELLQGFTIDSSLNFNVNGLSVSLNRPGKECFGPVKELSPLGGMDGSLDIHAYDADGNCMKLYVSSKPCHFQSVPTKVISIHPFMTFTNRLGEDLFLKLDSEDEPKLLHASDSRVSFVYQEKGSNTLQVRMVDTYWSFALEIVKEDTITLVLRKHDVGRRFLRVEIRGYEEGSRFLILFRLGSANGPFRMENRTASLTLFIRQCGLSDDAWMHLEPLSSSIFAWEDPHGQKLIEVGTKRENVMSLQKFSLEEIIDFPAEEQSRQQILLRVVEMRDAKIVQFFEKTKTIGMTINNKEELSTSIGSYIERKRQKSSFLELIVELGVVGISIIDHKPREILYLCLKRILISYMNGYNDGASSRFKLILGHLQLDNQLPLTRMPVLLAPEFVTNICQPIFKMTILMSNGNTDDIHVYPYVGIQVEENCWRINVHEPIIWSLVDFYNNIHLGHVDWSSSVTQVDPEIRFDKIDVSEVRMKLSLETAPFQRPQGALGMWSPILSTLGNAFKIQVHLRRVIHTNRFMRKSAVVPSIRDRIWRDLIHNPLHLLFSVDVIGMTSSTLASLSRGFAELSTDGHFIQLRSKQIWSRRISGVGDGIIQGTEALAQGVAFGVSGVVRKPMESARQHGLIGLVHGIGQAFVGFLVQPVSGALDFASLTVDGISASFSKCFGVFSQETSAERIRNPRAIHSNGVIQVYSEREAIGQMVLYLAEASRHFGCTDIFKEPSKFAWSDKYENHFVVPYQKVVLITSRRVMLLKCFDPDRIDKRPCKIIWDVPWEELLALELAKAHHPFPSHLILHLKNFRRLESFVRVIKSHVDQDQMQDEPQAIKICLAIRKMWKAYQSDTKRVILKVPSSQRHVIFAWHPDAIDCTSYIGPVIRSLESTSSVSLEERGFVNYSVNFLKIWISELNSKNQCFLCSKQASNDDNLCSFWRPICPEGYVSIGDIAHVGSHPPNVASVYKYDERHFAPPVGYDLVWRNCIDDYIAPVSIWYPRPPEGYVSMGCVIVPKFEEPQTRSVFCVRETMVQEAIFEESIIWTAPNSYPWACHIYQVQSEALHFVALRQKSEESDWRPTKILDDADIDS